MILVRVKHDFCQVLETKIPGKESDEPGTMGHGDITKSRIRVINFLHASRLFLQF
jgi:hypothetical protein